MDEYIGKCDVFLLFSSENTQESKAINKELKFTLELEITIFLRENTIYLLNILKKGKKLLFNARKINGLRKLNMNLKDMILLLKISKEV